MHWFLFLALTSGPALAFKAKSASNAELVEALDSSERDIRVDAAVEIQRRVVVDAAPKLIELVKSDPEVAVRKKALVALEAIRPDELYTVCDYVVRNDSDKGQRSKALVILEKTGPSSFSATVGYALANDEDIGVRRKAAIIIGKRGWADQQDALLAGAEDTDDKTRYASYRALIRLGDESTRALVHAGLENMDDEKLREEIARGLGESPLAVDRDPLIARLDDPDVDVAVLSARALAKLGDTSVGPMLREKSSQVTEEKRAEEFAKAAAQLGG